MLSTGVKISRMLNGHVIRAITIQAARKCHWLPHYKPGPYPKTEKEREEAAKKYNMFPEEYEPYPDDGLGRGDYPKLPFESIDTLDPYYDYDDQNFRRNFGEPMNDHILFLQPEAPSTHYTLTPLQKYTRIFAFIIPLSLLVWISLQIKNVEHVLERQLGAPGVTHYTFELDYDKKN